MSLPSRYYRAGVGAVIANREGLVLGLERSEILGAWQLPQGGWEANESAEEAMFREVEEETGIARDRLELIDCHPEPLVYELPRESQSAKTGMGQVQHWFLLRFKGDDMEFRLPVAGEFRAWSWMSMDQVVRRTVTFRRSLYQRLEARFSTWLKP